MLEEKDKNIRVTVKGHEGKHLNHNVRVLTIDKDKGIKALFCKDDDSIISYFYAKNKNWTLEKAVIQTKDFSQKYDSFTPQYVDQEVDFLKVIARSSLDEFMAMPMETYYPKSDSFILEEDIYEATTGWNYTIKAEGDDTNDAMCICPDCGAEQKKTEGQACSTEDCPKCDSKLTAKKDDADEKIIKVDKQKHLVYGVFLVPETPDHDGDVISAEDIEKVAHGFIKDYRDIDEMHAKTTMDADIVESSIAWVDDLEYQGKKLTKGTWFGAIHINDDEVWNKVLSGKYKAFSVRIAGKREKIGGAN